MKKLIVKLDNDVLEDLTSEEITELEQARTDAETAKQARTDAETAKETAQASGNQKLLDLGLTQAEATALTGYTPPTEV